MTYSIREAVIDQLLASGPQDILQLKRVCLAQCVPDPKVWQIVETLNSMLDNGELDFVRGAGGIGVYELPQPKEEGHDHDQDD